MAEIIRVDGHITCVTDTTIDLVRTRARLGEFKVCPLCGALNVNENAECFVCRWQGSFDHSRELIRLRIYEVVRGRPDFWDVWASIPCVRTQTRWQRFVSRVSRLLRGRRRIDLRI